MFQYAPCGAVRKERITMEKNLLKEKMLRQEKCLGTFFELGGMSAVEALAHTGLDFIIIDMEHGPFSPESAQDYVRAALLHQLTPLARVSEISRPAVMRPLDVGVQGLIIPCVETVEQVKQIVNYAKFSPTGKRGFCPSRRDAWGFAYPGTEDIVTNMRVNNEEVLVIPQCETASCLNAIESIAALPGVDGIFIGPFDLSISMGIPGQFDSREFTGAVARILRACRENGKFAFVFTGDEAAIPAYFCQGFDAVTYGLDAAVLINGFRQLVEKAKA